ncbi:MAG: M61 family metallopeptidase [Ardenticatenaceae bacterium]
MPVQIEYSIAMPQPATHRFHVTVIVTEWQEPHARLVLPAWTPGSYLIREFARHVENFQADTGNGSPLSWVRADKATWQIATGELSTFRVRYEVYANDLTVRTSHLDASHGYFNGTNVFVYLDGFEQSPVTLRVDAPAGWHTSIALPQAKDGRYHAATYDILADSPAEIGAHRVLRFEALDRPHEIALWGDGNEDEKALVRDLKQIVETVAGFFRDGLPYERYLFILHLGDRLGGGLEHRDSTTLGVDRWTFNPRDSYEKFLRLALHEFFHTWNVKRIRPAGLGPFDYTKEVYTPLLWVMEGFTTYYDLVLLRRAGLITRKRYLELLAERIATYSLQPGRHIQSLAESSLTTWIKFYRQDENYVNSGISYYLKGSLVALMLDLEMRRRSDNAASLDHLMRHLWESYGRRDVAFSPDEFVAALAEVAGFDLSSYLERFVRGTEDLPLESILRRAGLHLARSRGAETPEVWLGLNCQDRDGEIVVQNVLRDSPAEEAGLMANDRLLAIEGYEIRDCAFLSARLSEHEAGDAVTLHLFRYGLLLQKRVRLAEAIPDQVVLRPMKELSPLQRRILASWLQTEQEILSTIIAG